MQSLVINMAKLKKKPILITPEVKVENKDGKMVVSGSKGTMTIPLPLSIDSVLSGNELTLKLKTDSNNLALLGLYHSLVKNAVTGITTGWTKTLELVGVGFRAQTDGKKITLNVGFTHPVEIMAPEGIVFKVEENKITVSGIDKYLVGEMAAIIRKVKPPEPYKGKGIKYSGEKIRKKAGKAAKAVGGAPGRA